KSINDLYVYLVALQMSMQNNDALMPDNKPVVNYQAQISRLPEPFKPMLDQFVGQISQTSKDYQQTYKDTQKQMALDEEKKIVLAIAEQQDNSVKANCQALLANKYPINKTANEEVSLKELEQVFGSKGLYLQTLNSNIMANNQPSTPFKSLLEGGNRQPVYENAQGINARYLAGADKPFLNFTLKVVAMGKDIKELVIDYDAKKMTYYHGPQKSMRLAWPTNVDTLSLKAVTFDNKTHTIETKGEWAIFRLMDKATRTVNTKDGHGVIATFSFDEHDVHLELKSISGSNPFLLTGLRGFVC
ncbi:MAG: type VI secretion IcmF C-terminal domain-containing protein, partial [Moraxella sp.]|nr:type VI secretion IcmF C-terminal domain-containing protein [Moraxella sp.]